MDAFAQVRIVLGASREDGIPFDSAWYRALRQILPPEDCVPELRDAHEVEKQVLRETKPHYRAAYEKRQPTETELLRSAKLADDRLADIDLSRAA